MANYCKNNITVIATESEWKDIALELTDGEIYWDEGLGEVDCKEQTKTISFCSKWAPVLWVHGSINKLSAMHPTVIFKYETQGEDDYHPETGWFCNGKRVAKNEAINERLQAYSNELQRILSNTDNACNGMCHRVEIMPDGRVAADGQYSSGACNIFSWKDIAQISCGNWHTAGLTKEGTVVACGSNLSGQCDIPKLDEPATGISCGRYHTAILTKSGTVKIAGELAQEPFSSPLKITRSKCNYKQTQVELWPPVVRMKAVFDAVVGVTSSGEMLIDGFCPCSKEDLIRIMGKI